MHSYLPGWHTCWSPSAKGKTSSVSNHRKKNRQRSSGAAEIFVLLKLLISSHLSVIRTKISPNMLQRISHYCKASPPPTSSTTLKLSLKKTQKQTNKARNSGRVEGDEGQIRDPTRPKVCLTCRPMTHCPAFIFSSSNSLACLSAYFTPMSTPVWQPLVLA